MRVMICDDAGFVRAILAEICQKLGHQIVADCVNTQSLQLSYQLEAPDLIFLDIVLPEQDGLSFFRDIWLSADNQIRDRSTIVFMSSLGIDFVQSRIKQIIEEKKFEGEVYFLGKPFERSDLKEIFETIEIKKKRAG